MAYILKNSITKNITQDSKIKFLRKRKLLKKYEESRLSFEEFIMGVLNNRELSIFEFNEYLFDELFFGQQRSTFIYKLYLYKQDILDSEKLMKILNRVYGINDEYQLRITDVYSENENSEMRELVGCKIIKSINGNKVKKIKLLYYKKVDVELKNGTSPENSYVPVEIDLENDLLIVKVNPKAKVITEGANPEELVTKFVRKVERLFQLEFESFNHLHKETMYKICQELYAQVYNKMVFRKPQGIDEAVKNVSNILNNVLNIENLELKKQSNNIFNMNDNISKIVEHLLISDILFSTSDSEIIDGIDGFVTYIRFNDGNNVSARLKGENCIDPIFDSETFMALRSPIGNSKKLSILKVVWFKDGKNLRISYDTSNSLCLNIHFYKNLMEEDFNYGLNKYWEYEGKSFDEIERMASICSDKVAK